MSSIPEALQILGLSSRASWDEINQAYRDLVRVWHPDRFQADDRLRERAESQTRLINDAVALLRKHYDPNKSGSSSSSQGALKKDSSTPFETGFRQTKYQIAPLLLYQRPLIAVCRAAVAGGITYACLSSALEGRTERLGLLISLVGLFFGLYFMTANICFLIFRRPMLKVDSAGLRCFQTGFFAWKDLEKVWSVSKSKMPYLAIKCSTEFISAQPIWRKIFLRVRAQFQKAHFLIACAGYDQHPRNVVAAISGQYMMGHLSLAQSSESIFPWAKVAAYASATALLLRIYLGLNTSLIQLCVYAVVFTLGHAVDIGSRLVRLDP